jgi:uncharacterized GH25 family protein
VKMTRTVLTASLLLTFIGSAAAHNTFIMPEKFRVAGGDTVKIGFHSADGFPESTQLIRRLQDAVLHTAEGPIVIKTGEEGKRLAGSVIVPRTGYFLVTAVNGAATTEMKPDSFLSYLKEEGLTHVIQARTERGEAANPAKERYTMYAKSILLAGAPNDAYKRVAGHAIEIVPEKDPSSLKAGEPLPVRVLLRGAPARNLEIRALSTTPGAKEQVAGKTDANGRVNVPVMSGQWRIRTIHMDRSSKSDVEWESLWATLTLEIP